MKVGVTIKAIHYNSQLKTSLLVYDLCEVFKDAQVSYACLINRFVLFACSLVSIMHETHPACGAYWCGIAICVRKASSC